MDDALRQRLLNNDAIPADTRRRLASGGAGVPVVTGLSVAGPTQAVRERTSAELVEEYRARKDEEQAQLEASRQADEKAPKEAPLEAILDRLDTTHVPKDTLRRLKRAVIVEEHDDGSTSFKHDRGIRDNARIASR